MMLKNSSPLEDFNGIFLRNRSQGITSGKIVGW